MRFVASRPPSLARLPHKFKRAVNLCEFFVNFSLLHMVFLVSAVLFYRRVDFQSMHSLRRAGVWPPLLGLRFFLRLRESNRRAGRLIASAGAAGQRVAETGQPSFELQRPPMPPLLFRRRMVVMRARRGQQARRGGLCPALLDAHAIHSQQVSAAASEAWLRSHLRAKCPGSRVLHKPVSRSVGTYVFARYNRIRISKHTRSHIEIARDCGRLLEIARDRGRFFEIQPHMFG